MSREPRTENGEPSGGRGVAARWLGLLSLAIGLLAAPPLAAQDQAAPWRLSYFPYPTVSPNDGLMGVARAIWFRQAPWGERVTLRNSVAVEAGYSTRNAWMGQVTWANPSLGERWRIMAHAEAGHRPRFGDYDALAPAFFAEHDRQLAWVDLTHRFDGPVQVALRGGIRHDKLTYGTDGDAGAASVEGDETDATARGALVIDLRDREYETNTGVLLEAGGIAGSGGRDGYLVPYAQAKGWLHPWLPLRLTARVAWKAPADQGSLANALEFPGWEAPFDIIGGPKSVRGLPISTGLADGALLAGAEARFDVLNVGELGAVTLFAFVDGAKPLSSDDDLTIVEAVHPSRIATGPVSTGDWTWAPGGGIALRVLRAATLTVSAARADGQTRWYVGSGWAW